MMSKASALQGYFFRLSSSDVAACEEAARALHQSVVRLDLSAARNMPGLIRALIRDCQLGDDCPRTLSAVTEKLRQRVAQGGAGYLLMVSGYTLLQSMPTSFAMCNEVLSATALHWASHGVPFRVAYLDE